MCLYVYVSTGACGGQRRVWDAIDLKVQVLVSAGSQILVPCKCP